jgi:hypothetical protein
VPADAATDFQAQITQFVAANPDVESMVLLMKPANAVALGRALNQPTLPTLARFSMSRARRTGRDRG